MLHSINYCVCVFLKFICIYFFLYYRGPCVRKLFTGLIMYYPLKIKNIVLYCIVLYCIVLYCIVLYCIVLYCIVLYCIVKNIAPNQKVQGHDHWLVNKAKQLL